MIFVVLNELAWLCDISAPCFHPPPDTLEELGFTTLPIDGKRVYRVFPEPFDCFK